MTDTVKEGDWISLLSNGDTEDLTFVRYFPNRSVKVGGRKFRLAELQNPRFGCRIDFAVKSYETESQDNSKEEEQDNGETEVDDNEQVRLNSKLFSQQILCPVTSQGKFVYSTRH